MRTSSNVQAQNAFFPKISLLFGEPSMAADAANGHRRRLRLESCCDRLQ